MCCVIYIIPEWMPPFFSHRYYPKVQLPASSARAPASWKGVSVRKRGGCIAILRRAASSFQRSHLCGCVFLGDQKGSSGRSRALVKRHYRS